MSAFRFRRSVYVQATIDGKRRWVKVGTLAVNGVFTPGYDIALIEFPLEDA